MSARLFTVANAFGDIESILANAKRLMSRSEYLDLCVRVCDDAQDRSDAIHEEIRKEHHEDRDV